MIQVGSKVSWKVEGFPDAIGVVHDVDRLGFWIDTTDPANPEAGGIILKSLAELTEIKEAK